MPAFARHRLVPEGTDCFLHVVSRCVRRSFLCGRDAYSGRCFDHRRQWIKDRLQFLTGTFAVEIAAYAILSNHTHLVVACRPSQAASWSATEVADRWLRLFPCQRDELGHPMPPTALQIQALVDDPVRIETLRSRLGSVSWFMRCLNEWVARRANHEDECTGRFWEGRFKCQLLADEGAILACMAYVDLNPVRARAAESLQSSLFTSIYDRIQARQAAKTLSLIEIHAPSAAAASRDTVAPVADPAVSSMSPAHRSSTTPGLPCTSVVQAQAAAADWLIDLESAGSPIRIGLEGYLALVDWTGREIVEGKPGSIPEDMAPLLKALDLDCTRWLDTVQAYGSLFHRMVGRAETLVATAKSQGQRWLAGLRAARWVFRPHTQTV